MEFKIENTNVFGLDRSIVASGNPMRTTIRDVNSLTDSDNQRASRLANTQTGQGHDNFLNGIIVQFDLYAPLYMWKQIQRYHWIDFISSQSTMYCITKFNIKSQCNKYVWSSTIEHLQQLIDKLNTKYDKELWYEVISNIPSGFILGATITTNYRQLKTIYQQRKNHRLQEWHYFCEWVEKLPYSSFITNIKTNSQN